jgi:hypothetical protein
MLDRLTYEEIQILFTKTYVNDLGEAKYIKIAEKILTSNKMSNLLSRSRYQNIAVAPKDLLHTINSIPYFMFTSNRNQALAGLLALQRWNNDVNIGFTLANEETLKRMAIEIIKELKAHFITLGLNQNERAIYTVSADVGKGIYLLNERISHNAFLMKLGDSKYRISEIPSFKLITHYHTFDWNKLSNSSVANWNLDSSAELISYFDKTNELITRQNLKFQSFDSARILFELISTQNDWTVEAASPNKHKALSSSKDGRFKLELEKEKTEYSDDNLGWLMLSYLK